jgi:hypothetical protein
MLRSALCSAWLLVALPLCAQVVPAARRTSSWQQAGLGHAVPTYTRTVDIRTFGGLGDGRTLNDQPLRLALAALAGHSGVVEFPSGTFQFRQSVSLPDSAVLRGQSADSTTLRFDLGGAAYNSIDFTGSVDPTTTLVSASAAKDSAALEVPGAATLFRVGDWLLLTQNDSALVTSNWAYGSVGQVVRVRAVRGNRLELASQLRKDFLLADRPRVRRIVPRRAAGIECLRIRRGDATVAQTSHVAFSFAVGCWLRGVESDSCNLAHVAASYSAHLSITGSYFHRAFAYGGGGQGYGVLLQYATSECLIEDNVFDRLRHALLLQAGANGNVLAYNSSTDPVQATAPTNLSPDMVLHGNYPFQNLFEGNLFQTISIDNSHGANGAYNLFFRNRAEAFGLSVSAANSGNQNFVGNEIPNTGTFMGNYLLTGAGHFEYGNNVRGVVLPAGTTALPDSSYYLTARPTFFTPADTWPAVGWPAVLGSGTNPARRRALGSANPTVCASGRPLGVGANDKSSDRLRPVFLPNPAVGGEVRLAQAAGAVRVVALDVWGQRVAEATIAPGAALPLTGWTAGLYILRLTDATGRTTMQRLTVQ